MTRVLLVDDDESNRLTMSALLEDEGFDVREASSFQEARVALEGREPFAIVLMDQHLGDGLGSNLVPLARSRLPGARIVMMSGSLDETPLENTPERCFTKGDDFAKLLELLRE